MLYSYKNIKIIKFLLNVILISSFTGLMLWRDVFNHNMAPVIFTVISIMILLINDMEGIIAFITFMIPSYIGLQYGIVVLAAIIIVLFKYWKNFKFRGVLVIITILLMLIEYSSSVYGKFNFEEYLKFSALIILVMVIIPCYKKRMNFVFILKTYLWGFLFMEINIIGQYLTKYSWTKLLNLGIRLGNVANDLNLKGGFRVSNDQNLLGTFAVIAISLVLVMGYKKMIPQFYYIFIVFAALLGIMTQSRAFFVSSVFTFLYYIVFIIRKPFKSLTTLITMAFMLFFAYYIINSYFSSYLDNYILRFTQVSDITNSRNQIFDLYNDFFFSHPQYIPFGMGIQTYMTVARMTVSCHNGFQQLYITWGFVGMFLVIVMLYQVYKVAVYGEKKPVEWLCLLTTFIYFLNLQTAQWFSNGGFILLMIICFYSIKLSFIQKDMDQPEYFKI